MAKNWVMGSVFFFSLAAGALPLPRGICANDSCLPEQLKIWNAFEAAAPLAPQSMGRIFSGVCYHRSADYNGRTPHYGVVYFNEAGGVPHMTGTFGFFFPENPYRDITLQNAEARLTLQKGENSIVRFEDSYAWVDFNPGQAPLWQYRLRQAGPNVELIGHWGTGWTLFCELEPNP